MKIVKDRPARLGDAGASAAETLIDYLATASQAAVRSVVTPSQTLTTVSAPALGRAPLRLGNRLFGGSSLFAPRQNRPAARMGQLYGGSYADQYNAVVSVLEAVTSQGYSAYDAFVAFTIAHKPANLAWTVDAYSVNEALKIIEANYARRQSIAQAAAFGVRFPKSLTADIAFSRLQVPDALAGYLGVYTPLTGFLTTTQNDQAAQGLMAQLGPSPTFFYTPGQSVYLVGWQSPSVTTVGGLTGTSDLLGRFLDHVYRALAVWIPAMAVRYRAIGRNPAEVYSDFDAPGLYNSASFVLWTIAANTFQFDRFNNGANAPANQALRDVVTTGVLNEAESGFRLAGDIGTAEINLGQLIGQSIQSQIDYLSFIQYILKILALPVSVILNVLTGGKFPDLLPEIPWYVYAGLGVFGLVGTYAALK